MPCYDKFDLGMIGEGIKDGIDLGSGYPKDYANACIVNAFDDDMSYLRLVRHCLPSVYSVREVQMMDRKSRKMCLTKGSPTLT